jgi:SAM-dependent methyltransferase
MTERAGVDPSNSAQLAAWDGAEGAYWAGHADAFDRSMRAYDGAFFDAMHVACGERVLDVGCGAGQVTCRAAASAGGSGHALGIDLSAAMLEVARGRADAMRLANARFVHGDAQVHPFTPESVDAVVSRSGAMFFGDPVCAFANLARATRPGGRIVLLTWQGREHNEWLTEVLAALSAGRNLPGPPPAAPGPFALSEPDRVTDILVRAGWIGVEIRPLVAPMYFGGNVDEAHAFVSGLMAWLYRDLDEAGRREADDALRATMRAHDGAEGVAFGSAAWLILGQRG